MLNSKQEEEDDLNEVKLTQLVQIQLPLKMCQVYPLLPVEVSNYFYSFPASNLSLLILQLVLTTELLADMM